MEQMYADIKAGKRAQFDARDYYHNRMIDKLFQQARRRAWAKIRDNPEAQQLMERAKTKKLHKAKKVDTRKHPQHIQINGNNIRRIHWGW